MILVDTNVYIYALNTAAREHDACVRLVEAIRLGSAAWFSTWPILYETMSVATNRRVLPSPLDAARASDFVDSLLESPSLTVLVETDRHAGLLRQTIAEISPAGGRFFHDLHTAVLMREHGIRRIVTRDTDFHWFPFLEVIDPLAPPSSGWPVMEGAARAYGSARMRRRAGGPSGSTRVKGGRRRAGNGSTR